MTKTLKPKISVLTPSNRGKDAINVVAKSLMRQSFLDFEWVVGSPKKETELLLEHELCMDPPKLPGDYWVLNKLYNNMIRRASGELIVSIQDNTSFAPDALEKFWFHYQNDPMVIVSGVGNKYADDTYTKQTWQDPRQRIDKGSFYEVYFADIEGNFCAIPKDAIISVGGFDEELDKFAGMDWYSVLARLHLDGKYKFFLDQTNESKSIEHGRYENWEERNAIHGPYQERAKFYQEKTHVLRFLR